MIRRLFSENIDRSFPGRHLAKTLAAVTVLVSGLLPWVGANASFGQSSFASIARMQATASLNAQAPDAFIPVGNMTTLRIGHTATLLPGGKVLIAGGAGGPVSTSGAYVVAASAELYDPSTGSFSPTGNMTVPRLNHTATLLADGRVLIAGGESNIDNTNTCCRILYSAELYDPSTGTFTATGPSRTTAWTGTATLLNDGRVLLIAGADHELYDPATGTLSVTGAFAGAYTLPRVNTVTLLPDGTVLITGCDAGTNIEVDWCSFPVVGGPVVELYDPSGGTFSLTGGGTGPMDWWDNLNMATLLRSGKVLVAGSDGGLIETALLYDPSTRIFSGIGNYPAGNYPSGSTATLLLNGELLIAGGQDGISGSVATGLYDPSTGTFSAGTNMTIGRFSHTATLLLNGTVLIAGGYSSAATLIAGGYTSTATSSAELYVPSLLTPPLIVTDLRFDSAVVPPGASYSADISGSGLTAETFFDARFTSPGTSRSSVVLNWQKGSVESHDVPTSLGVGTWTINGVRAHEIETDHTGSFAPVSATIIVAPVTAQVVTGLQFDRPSVVAGGSYSVNLSGSNLTPQTFFDVRFTAPGSNTPSVALNWQTGLAASHAVPLDIAPGNWTINGVRAHQNEADDTGDFNPVSATITVVPFP